MPCNSRDYIKEYECTLRRLQDIHHSQCIFRIHPPVDNLKLFFSEDGTLQGRFVCSSEHQGYDNIVHGGIIAALIDASMAQCCMGHGIVAYTVDLSIHYRNPVRIDIPSLLETRIVERKRGVLFSLECHIRQKGRLHVEAKGRFFRVSDDSGPGRRSLKPGGSIVDKLMALKGL
jgi:uncharacterized protein (TIGR00369 family)